MACTCRVTAGVKQMLLFLPFSAVVLVLGERAASTDTVTLLSIQHFRGCDGLFFLVIETLRSVVTKGLSILLRS